MKAADIMLKLGVDISALKKAQAQIKRTITVASNVKTAPFQGWALSVMFAGMAIKNTMNSIWKASSKTFQDIMHSQEGTVTGFDRLDGAMTYLAFTAGQALEPLAELLVPIIDYIAELIQDHPGAFRWMFGIATVVGVAMTAIGGLWLALVNGIIPAFKILGVVGKGAIGAITKGFAFLAANPIVLLIAGLFLVIAWIFKLKTAMGGWGEFAKSVIRGVLRAFVGLGDGLWYIITQVGDAFKWMINLVISGINKLLESDVVQWGAKKLGISVNPLAKLDYSDYQFGDLLGKYFEWETSSWLAPNNGYMQAGGLVPEQQTIINGDVNMNVMSQTGQVNVSDTLAQLRANTTSGDY